MFKVQQVDRVDAAKVECQHEEVPVDFPPVVQRIVPDGDELFRCYVPYLDTLRFYLESSEGVSVGYFIVYGPVEYGSDVPQVYGNVIDADIAERFLKLLQPILVNALESRSGIKFPDLLILMVSKIPLFPPYRLDTKNGQITQQLY